MNSNWMEIGFGSKELDALGENRKLWSHGSSDRFKELQRLLIQRLLWIAREVLTEKQLEVFDLLLEDNVSQQEMADRLGKSQSAISKTLLGNRIYTGKYRGKQHGGLFHKLRKACAADADCQRILKRMAAERQRVAAEDEP
jgi:predicted DNA-binding protein YlxM (UPF0122 family)